MTPSLDDVLVMRLTDVAIKANYANCMHCPLQ